MLTLPSEIMVQLRPLSLMVMMNGHPLKTTHKRIGQNIYPIVGFTAATEFTGKKEEFLSRDVNKQRLIQMISDELRKRDCTVVNALGDADVDIVKAAVKASRLHTNTLIGEDTDLLVLLLYYAQGDTMALYFKSDRT